MTGNVKNDLMKRIKDRYRFTDDKYDTDKHRVDVVLRCYEYKVNYLLQIYADN